MNAKTSVSLSLLGLIIHYHKRFRWSLPVSCSIFKYILSLAYSSWTKAPDWNLWQRNIIFHAFRLINDRLPTFRCHYLAPSFSPSPRVQCICSLSHSVRFKIECGVLNTHYRDRPTWFPNQTHFYFSFADFCSCSIYVLWENVKCNYKQ